MQRKKGRRPKKSGKEDQKFMLAKRYQLVLAKQDQLLEFGEGGENFISRGRGKIEREIL